ncbi:MAG: ribosome silencing factor [Ruminococcaceae bacterium]|nr:ribosome silencing factor [Oscillospiraceae bacterium]
MELENNLTQNLPEGADSLATAEFIVTVLDSKKAKDIKLLHVEKQTVLADYFIVCSGNSRTQIKSLADEVEYRMTRSGIEPLHVEGGRGDSWILLDYGSVIVHVFGRDAREFYNLEKLYDGTVEEDISELLTED